MNSCQSLSTSRAGLAGALSLFIMTSASVAGVSVEGQPVFGELGFNAVNADPFDDVNFVSQIQDTGVIGPLVEINIFGTHDFSVTGDTLVSSVNAGFAALPFNGFRFELTDPIAPEIVSMTLVSSTFPGFDASRVFFAGTRMALNFDGLSGVGDITIAITYAGPPAGCPGDVDGNNAVGTSDLLALLAAWGPNPGHAADLDGDNIVGTSDLLLLLAAWGPCPGACPATGVTYLGDAPLPPDFVTQISASPLVTDYLATFGINGWSLDLVDGFEVFYDGLPPAADGARHAMVPVTDGIGDGVGYFIYTYNPGSGIEGADLMQIFDETPDNRLRFFVDPSLDIAVDMMFDDDGCITGSAVLCPRKPGCTTYTRCIETCIATALGTGGTAPTATCITRCLSNIFTANCRGCVGSAGAFIVGCWWGC